MPALNGMFDALYPPGLQWYWKGDFFEKVDAAAIALHLKYSEQLPTMHSAMHLYPIDGAASRVGDGDTAWAYRRARFSRCIVGVDPDPANVDRIRSWARDYWMALHPHSSGGAYVNFMMADEGDERVRATYGGNYERLARVKQQVRPGEPLPRESQHRGAWMNVAGATTQGRSTLKACIQSFRKKPGMHQSMHRGSIAARLRPPPQSSVSQPNCVEDAARPSFAPASLPQMNIVGVAGSFGLTMSALPTLEKAFTNCAAGAFFCSRSMQRLVRPREVRENAVVGRRLGDRVGRVEHDLAVKAVAAQADRLLRPRPLDGEDDDLPEGAASANVPVDAFDSRAGLPRRELRGIARAAHDLVAVLQEAVREHLPHLPRAQNADLVRRHAPEGDVAWNTRQ